MNKKILVTALGAALAASPMLAAQADVTIYGAANVELSDQSVEATGVADVDGYQVQDVARGRIGIKASEDMGGGLKGIAKFEWRVNTDQGGSTAGNREAYVGLKGGFGTFQAGNLKTAYKYTGGVNYDPFVTTSLEARGNGGMTGGVYGHNSFLDSSFAWMSPNWDGLKVWVNYSLDENGDEDGGTGTGEDLAASVKYDGGGFEIFGAVVQNTDRTKTGLLDDDADYEAAKFGGKIELSKTSSIAAQYETFTQDDEANILGEQGFEGTNIFVGYQLGVNKWTLVAQGGLNTIEFDAAGLDDQETTYTAIGGIYKYSKQTRFYGGYRLSDVESVLGAPTIDGEVSTITVGLRKDF